MLEFGIILGFKLQQFGEQRSKEEKETRVGET